MFEKFFSKKDKSVSNRKYFEVLSLSGGGVYGLYSARIIQHLEEYFGDHIGEKVDLLVGTSIGGIIALGLSRKVKAEDIVKTFFDRSHLIFQEREKNYRTGLSGIGKFTSGMMRAKYDSSNLYNVIKSIIDEDLVMADALYPVMITSYDLTTGSIRTFSCPVSSLGTLNDNDVSMVDVAMATSAVPAMFPIHEIDGHRFVDGAVFANAPDMVAFKEAIFRMEVPFNKVKILSVGTMMGRFFLEEKVRNDSGFISWGLNNRLPTLMVSAQNQFTVSMMSDLLGDNYLRVDTSPSNSIRNINLSHLKKEDLNLICKVADNSWKSILKDSEFLKNFGK